MEIKRNRYCIVNNANEILCKVGNHLEFWPIKSIHNYNIRLYASANSAFKYLLAHNKMSTNLKLFNFEDYKIFQCQETLEIDETKDENSKHRKKVTK